MRYSEFAEDLDFDRLEKKSDQEKKEFAWLTHFLQSYQEQKTEWDSQEDQHTYGDAERIAGKYFKHGTQSLIPFEWDVPYPPVKNPEFTFIDLFAGIGGFRIAMQELKGKCVFSSEWDKFAQKTYAANFGEVPFGDIRLFTDSSAVNDEELNRLIPDHDVLCAGFPCQPFSLAGVSARNSLGRAHGFLDEIQGNLFFDIARIASIKKPKVLFLENVKNFRNHDKGKTFKVVKSIIEELGYSFYYKTINSSSLVPQRRERIFMIGVRSKKVKFLFPDLDGSPIPLKSILEKDVPESFTISDKLWEGHQNRTKRNLERGTGFTAFTANLNKPANTLVARYGKDGKECLIPQKNKNPRKLTPRECARLQGFPESYLIPVSNAAAYRQFGNSVAVPVIKSIGQSIAEIFDKKKTANEVQIIS